MIVDFLKQWGILHWEIAHTPYRPITRNPISLSPSISDTLLPGHPISLSTYLTHPISLSPYFTLTLSHSHPISLSPYLTLSHSHHISPYFTLTLSHSHPISLTPYLTLTLSHSHPISLSPYLTLTLSHPISLSPYLTLTLSHSHPISLSPYLTLTLSHSHPISLSPYHPCAQEVSEGMLELERSRIETATELEQLHDQKDNLQEHLSVLKHTLVVVTLSHACTCRHASSRLCFRLFLQICSTFKVTWSIRGSPGWVWR